MIGHKMSLFPKKMPVWLVALIGTIVVLVLLLISPLSNPIKRPLAKKVSELWNTRYQLDSPKAEHRIKALRLMSYNKKHDDALLLQLARLATEDSNTTVRQLARIKLQNAARRQTLPDAAIRTLGNKLQELHNPELPQIVSTMGYIASKHNRYNDNLIMDISRIAESKANKYLGRTALVTLGQIGAQQSLPDASLDILTRIFQKSPNAYNLPQAFERIASRRPLPDATISALIMASRNHKQNNIRRAAIKALAAHCRKHPCQAGWFQHALEDKNSYVRQTAIDATLQMDIKAKGEKQVLIDVLRDETRPTEIRRHIVRRLHYKYRRDDDVKALLMSLTDDPDASMRLIPLRYYTGLDRNQHQTNPVWLQRIKKALADPDAGVRKQAIGTLINMGFKDSTKTTLLVSAMQDKDAKVRAWAIGAIQPAYYKDPAMRVAVAKAVADPVAKVRQRAKSSKQRLEYRASGAYERNRKSRKSKKKITEVVFWVILSINVAW
jgi:HEAT repeat protein